MHDRRRGFGTARLPASLAAIIAVANVSTGHAGDDDSPPRLKIVRFDGDPGWTDFHRSDTIDGSVAGDEHMRCGRRKAGVAMLFRRSIVCGLFASSLLAAAGAAAGSAVPLDAVVPILLRDDGVRRELELTPDVEQRLDRLLGEWNERFFGMRMLSPDDEGDVQQFAAGMTEFREGLAGVLSADQLARLNGLRLQANGWRSLLDESVARDLLLTGEQQKDVEAALAATADAVKQAAEPASQPAGDPAADLQKIRQAEHDRITRLLSPQQKARWLKLVGKQYDLASVRQSAGAAPELQGITEWWNSPPLTLGELRGDVVVLHFIASDCINCIRNLPHYRKWHDEFADRGVTVLGVHTPETTAERDETHVREALAKHDVTWPVAHDAESKTWAAWSNRMWPSTYLIDKRGDVRFWWYGELQWEGAEGERLMRERIERLLAEEAP